MMMMNLGKIDILRQLMVTFITTCMLIVNNVQISTAVYPIDDLLSLHEPTQY